MIYSQALKDLEPSERSLLFEYVCNLNTTMLLIKANDEIPSKQYEKLENCRKRIKAGEPVSYIVGFRDFYKSRFAVNQNVLVPQSDTETLVEKAVSEAEKCTKTKLKILDLCTGSGCVGISTALELCKKFEIHLTLSDISPKALEVAKQNSDSILKGTNVTSELIESDLFNKLKNERFDFILTNPPYISSGEIEKLDINVQKEPHIALDGGNDGLEIIRKIVFNAHNNLENGGFLIMEIGYNQGKSVKTLFTENGFTNVEVLKDLGNRDRVVFGKCMTN